MKILTLETTGRYGSAAVIGEDGSVYAASSYNEMNHLKDVVSLADEAVRMAGINKSELTHVAASAGPGSFTGIRIGVTAARTIGQMLGIPCIRVSALEAMAERVLEAAAASGASYIIPLINARRHQTYAGIWRIGTGESGDKPVMKPDAEERQYMIEEVLETAGSLAERGMIYFTGDGIDAYGDIIGSSLDEEMYYSAPESLRYQYAGSAAVIALRKAAESDVLSYEELVPEYMRLSEAEQRLRDGTLSDKIRNAGKIIK